MTKLRELVAWNTKTPSFIRVSFDERVEVRVSLGRCASSTKNADILRCPEKAYDQRVEEGRTDKEVRREAKNLSHYCCGRGREVEHVVEVG